MSQYREIKEQYSDCILLFRVGDFYETFFEDAVDVASVLQIALTTRDKNKPEPIPLAGVPFHAVETYVTRLLAAGRRVAICDQVEDPTTATGLVRREVTEVLTPGTALNTNFLSAAENNYCLSVCTTPAAGPDSLALAIIDVSTGDMACGQGSLETAVHLLQGRRVSEVIVPTSLDRALVNVLLEGAGNPSVQNVDDRWFEREEALAALARQFESPPELDPGELPAVGALLRHCHTLRAGPLAQLVAVQPLAPVPFLGLDPGTIGNLELFEPQPGNDRRATLIATIDTTSTSMGARELRRWVEKPLADPELINRRLDAVASLYSNSDTLEKVCTALRGMSDIQRLVARIAARKNIPRELHALRETLERVPRLWSAIADETCAFMRQTAGMLDENAELIDAIDRAIVAEPPGHIRDGGVIRKGFDATLDAILDESEAAKVWIAALERREREQTGIAALKVGYNKVFGYYIEVSAGNVDRVPDRYIPRQTLVSAQRYHTVELKEKEDLILRTEERRVREEQRVYNAVCARVSARTRSLQRTAAAVARVDVIASLAATAKKYGYQRPTIDKGLELEIVGGRHPVLERFVERGFVPNDLHLDPQRRQLGLITGPNMSGKSTFLRQTALVVILAQMGSFVPARRAVIGIVDQVFTRVGASDRLSRGESTFLVEMNETASILATMTDRSLVLLDEIGRGTSTFDGLSIAWSVTEYLLEGRRARPRTLFATHFHELTQLRSVFPRLVNLKITIREWEGGIIFLRKIVAGTSDRSFGIHAARVAGLPESVVRRAQEILDSLERRRGLLTGGVEPLTSPQYGLFEAPAGSTATGGGNDQAPESVPPTAPSRRPDPPEPRDPVRARIAAFDLEHSTPLDAYDLLRRLKERTTDSAD